MLGYTLFLRYRIGPAYLGSSLLGGILGMGIFLERDIAPVYLGLYQLGGIMVPTSFWTELIGLNIWGNIN